MTLDPNDPCWDLCRDLCADRGVGGVPEIARRPRNDQARENQALLDLIARVHTEPQPLVPPPVDPSAVSPVLSPSVPFHVERGLVVLGGAQTLPGCPTCGPDPFMPCISCVSDLEGVVEVSTFDQQGPLNPTPVAGARDASAFEIDGTPGTVDPNPLGDARTPPLGQADPVLPRKAPPVVGARGLGAFEIEGVLGQFDPLPTGDGPTPDTGEDGLIRLLKAIGGGEGGQAGARGAGEFVEGTSDEDRIARMLRTGVVVDEKADGSGSGSGARGAATSRLLANFGVQDAIIWIWNSLGKVIKDLGSADYFKRERASAKLGKFIAGLDVSKPHDLITLVALLIVLMQLDKADPEVRWRSAYLISLINSVLIVLKQYKSRPVYWDAMRESLRKWHSGFKGIAPGKADATLTAIRNKRKEKEAEFEKAGSEEERDRLAAELGTLDGKEDALVWELGEQQR